MHRRNILIAAVALLVACDRTDTNAATKPPAETAANAEAPLAPPAPGTPGGLPDDRTPLAEPKGQIDPKSAEAAGQVMQHYGALIEQRRLAEAAAYWGDASAAAQFAKQFDAYSEVHAQIGKPGDAEGGAGSIYVSVPFQLYGRLKAGGQFSRLGTANLRRVNDVPGSTEEQRRWHIAGIEWAS